MRIFCITACVGCSASGAFLLRSIVSISRVLGQVTRSTSLRFDLTKQVGVMSGGHSFPVTVRDTGFIFCIQALIHAMRLD